MAIRFAVVLVTYNRLECLKIALRHYAEQTLQPAYVVVVNNASSDGTREFLDQWKTEKDAEYQKVLIHSAANLGGAGGFALGMERAMQLDCDFLFLADDDAYAAQNMLEQLDAIYCSFADKDTVAALCTAVVNHGQFDCCHRRRILKSLFDLRSVEIDAGAYHQRSFEVDELSFVGCAVKKSVVAQIGLPKREYFIYYDDTEYSARIRKLGKIICIPSAQMNHNVGFSTVINWKEFYGCRNRLDYIRCHYSKFRFFTAVLMTYIKKCSVLAIIIKKRPIFHRKLYRRAIHKALHREFGIDKVYMPGVDIEKI